MPFRLLGLIGDPSQASSLCGRVFAHYAASGTDVSLVCAATPAGATGDKAAARQLGVRDLILLDYALSDLTAATLEDILADLLVSVRPHVVVADCTAPAIRDAALSAFLRVRRAAGGSSALPAKLYYRSGSSPLVSVTTSIAGPAGTPPELFVRVFPDPWVTGVLERDLFAGVAAEVHAPSLLDQQMAS